MKPFMRILRDACMTPVALVMLMFAAVQFKQWLMLWRAEQLMEDIHGLRLYQSTWGDAHLRGGAPVGH
jgi:hypothetical protein